MNILKNIFYIFLPILLGSLIGLLTSSFMDYSMFLKPPLSPPSFLFPIVWSIIYLLIGISYYLYRKKNEDINYLYYIQLIINLLWSIIFFIFKLRFIAILWIILLDILIILNMIKFYKTNKISLYLFIPYLIWCLYATYLTFGIYILN